MARIGRTFNAERKSAFVALLLQYWCENASDADAPPPAFVVPVPYEPPAPEPLPSKKKRKRSRRAKPRQNHNSALDLFTDEGTPIPSATRGVVCSRIKNGSRAKRSPPPHKRAGIPSSYLIPTSTGSCAMRICRMFLFPPAILSAQASLSARSAIPASMRHARSMDVISTSKLTSSAPVRSGH